MAISATRETSVLRALSSGRREASPRTATAKSSSSPRTGVEALWWAKAAVHRESLALRRQLPESPQVCQEYPRAQPDLALKEQVQPACEAWASRLKARRAFLKTKTGAQYSSGLARAWPRSSTWTAAAISLPTARSTAYSHCKAT